ncbi:MAG TPA: hypothetical protein VG755_31010 [Nannocystaceae bacterium]|nr:hypothetical protein [Nannocystaceae bacterium]
MRWSAALALVIACTSSSQGDTSTSTSTSSTSSSGGTTPAEASSTADGSSSGSNIVIAPDGGVLTQCDVYADGCPDGEKCMPYASDGGLAQDATRCVPLADNPGFIDAPCTVQEWIASGLDDCGRGLFCVVYEPTELTGRCLSFCIEDPELDDLTCADPNARCVGPPDALPRLCATDCDPFGTTCPDGYGCYKVNDHFVCLDDVSGPGGAYGDSCLFTNDCDPGMRCVVPDNFFECASTDGCCSPLCDTRDPDASAMCPGAPNHACVPIFDEGEGPPLFDWVGACQLPA